jgi:lipopolysaccharide/colanic/teichoic acid biosynthesis glycosyltransferase
MEANPLPIHTRRTLKAAEPAAPEPSSLPHRALPPGMVRPLRCRWYPAAKAVLDFVLALALSVPALPIILLSAVAIKLTTRGPAFYTQTRIGRQGKLFTIYKLRTMIDNCESLTGARWSIPGDPRVTPVGWFLRASHLDELPQLLNVLKGDMSLIGPRPERPEFLPELEEALPVYTQRLAVRPGVTGLAQVQLPPDSDIGSVRRKLAHDLYYIRHLTPWLDLRLLLCTALYAAAVPSGVFRRMLGIPGRDAIEADVRDLLGEENPSARAVA